jgi:hypothetical protein
MEQNNRLYGTEHRVNGLIVPTVHLNGTSKDELIAQLDAALDALSVAQAALLRAAPNARDYYVQGVSAYARADAEHVSRMQRLNSVKSELQQLAIAVYDQR